MVQIFISHTKKDVEFCDKFDRIFAREEKIKAFRSEFEAIEPPAWETIKKAISDSVALVLLVGSGLVNNQKALFQDNNWKFTQNWIAFEIGIACQKGIDVWAVCDEDVKINFPMPYITNYITAGLDFENNFKAFRELFKEYANEKEYKYPYLNYGIKCPYEDCNIKFNLIQYRRKGDSITCPQCLRSMIIRDDYPIRIRR